MNSRFSVESLQHAELAEPFSFTKGCPTLKVPARSWIDAHSFGTELFDLGTDPEQQRPLQDVQQEARMTRHLIEQMRANDAPPEQFERLGLKQDE